MNRDDFYVECTLLRDVGDIAMASPKQMPIAPAGCHWFRDCGMCRWEDCLVCVPARYESEKGRRLRGAAFAEMLRSGVPLGWMARFFGLAERQVKEEAAPYDSTASFVSIGPGRGMLKTEAVRRRMAGEPEMAVASALGVSARQVRRWCQGVEGIRRGDGNRWRNVQATMITQQNPAMIAIEQRCQVVRRYFE